MSNEQNLNITIDQVTLLSPLMAGEILNAYYSALLLKQQQGIELTEEIKTDTLTEVLLLWSNIQILLEDKMPKKLKPLGTSVHQQRE